LVAENILFPFPPFPLCSSDCYGSGSSISIRGNWNAEMNESQQTYFAQASHCSNIFISPIIDFIKGYSRGKLIREKPTTDPPLRDSKMAVCTTYQGHDDTFNLDEQLTVA